MATDYSKFLRDNYVESAVLFGEYNEQDEYSIDQAIKEELVNLNKVITEYKQDYIMCQARVFETVANFRIDIFLDEMEGEKYANLYLLESFKNLDEEVDLETFLVNFTSSNDPVFFDKLKEALHLFTQSELGEGKQLNTSEVLERLLRGKKDVSKSMMLNMGVDNRKYCNDILKILKNSKAYPSLEKLIKQKMKGIKADKNTAKYFALLKEILDEVIKENYDELDEETRQWLQQVNQNYVLIYMNKKKIVQKPKVKTETVVAGKKSSGKSKSGGGGGGGGGGGDKKDKSSPSSSSSGLNYSYEPKPYDLYVDRYGKFPGGRMGPPPPPYSPQIKEIPDYYGSGEDDFFWKSLQKAAAKLSGLPDEKIAPIAKDVKDLGIQNGNEIEGVTNTNGLFTNLSDKISTSNLDNTNTFGDNNYSETLSGLESSLKNLAGKSTSDEDTNKYGGGKNDVGQNGASKDDGDGMELTTP